MGEIKNTFLEAVENNSDLGENITNNEWQKIKNNKDMLLSSVNGALKNKFEFKYEELDYFFNKKSENTYKTTTEELRLFKNAFKTEIKSNQEVKSEFISKYSKEYKNLQGDVVVFLDKAFSNGLLEGIGDFNVDKFNNKDKLDGFSKYELEEYALVLDKAMNQMNILGGYEEFKESYNENGEEPDFFSWKGDIALANKVDLQEYLLGEGNSHLTDNLHSYSENELHEMREESFDITDSDKMKNFLILLGIELGDGVQDILRFIGNIPSGLILLPRYIDNRIDLRDGNIDTKDEVEAQMEQDILLKENPSLIICELLGEKGIQMLKQLGEMFVSGKNGDIAMLLVTIAGLLAGGAGAVKFVAKTGKMKKVADIAGNVQNKAAKVDDIVGGAGIGHMTGEFSNKGIEKNIVIEDPIVGKDKIDKFYTIYDLLLLKDKTDKELKDYIFNIIKENPNIKEIDLSSVLDSHLKERLNSIIGLNFPLLNITRLMPGQNVVDITFLGVKHLNDKISKEFVDLFNDKFKKVVRDNFDSSIKEPKHGRLIRSDYKHITFSLPNDVNPLQILFEKAGSREKFISDIFDSIPENQLLKSMEKASESLTRSEIKERLLTYFDFGLGVAKVPGNKGSKISNEQKLESFYRAEISSRVKPKGEGVDLVRYDFDKTKQLSQNAFKVEVEIVSTFENKVFTLDGVDYDIVKKLSSGEKVINPYLLRYIRKGKDIGNIKLEGLVKKYLNSINDAFDFISPAIKSEKINSFDEINDISKSIITGKIDISSLEKNYKGTYTKEALEKISTGKEGMRIFVDIVDMGIMNLEDFRGLAKKVSSGEIKADNISELLDAGLSVTKKFQDFVKKIEEIPGAKVSLGGDEVFIFIEGKTTKETYGIIKNITNNLNNNGLRGRVSYSFTKGNEKLFDDLDSLTKINKVIEKKIEESIIGNKLLNKVPNNLSLDINPSIIGTKEGDFDKFLHSFEKSINSDDLIKVIKSIDGKEIKIGSFNGKTVYLKKNGVNEFILSVK